LTHMGDRIDTYDVKDKMTHMILRLFR